MSEILRLAEEFLLTEVAPKANLMDRDTSALQAALDGLCKRNLMALRRPKEYGGPALSETEFREFQVMVARYSGSLAFLQTQHQSAVSMISKGENSALKVDYLPKMADGQRLVGIAFSQLRRPGPPILRATRLEGGYQLDGHVPWLTGFQFFHEFLIGAALESGESVFGIVPFTETPGIRFGPVLRLAAMESPQTVTADLTGFFLPDSLVSFHKPAGWIHENDSINITIQGFFSIGCARAGLDVLHAAFEKKSAPAMKLAFDCLDEELDRCRAAMVAAQDEGPEDITTEDKLRVRAWAIDLAVRCAHAGVAASSGAANSLDHNAQRVYREALVYTVSAQTAPVMQATLERLCERGG